MKIVDELKLLSHMVWAATQMGDKHMAEDPDEGTEWIIRQLADMGIYVHPSVVGAAWEEEWFAWRRSTLDE